jgi:phosphoribosylformylglycinamidine (FGAM) synthase PurS component
VDQLHYLLKLYAGWAGLKAEEITCHTLRHTAVMRLVEEAEEEGAVAARLGRRSASKTKEYLEAMRSKPSGQLRRRKGGLWKKGQAPPRGPCRTKLRNHLALRHGLRAKYLPELEWMDEQGMQLSGLERELVRWRVVVRRAAMLSGEAETIKEAVELLEAGSTAAVRVGKVLKYMDESKVVAEAAAKAEWDEAVAEEIEKVLEEEWPKWDE